MKKLFFIAIIALAQTATAQDYATNVSGNDLIASVAGSTTNNFVITSAYYDAPSSSKSVKVVEPNYKKLQVNYKEGSSVIHLNSNFEGTVKLSYILTNNSGQVIASNEVKLPSGLQSYALDMKDYNAGDYFITARVCSKVTKVQSNYSFKIEKK
jgi:hypothetical protein